MMDQGVVVAIRLSDVSEVDQPDPLSLRPEDLSKWRPLEVMLQNMYKDPPETIRVTYKDNEDDWVQISCDEELAEAVRLTRETNGILSFAVKRLDCPVYYESTLPPASVMASQRTGLAATKEASLNSAPSHPQPLVYPQPTDPPTPGSVMGGSQPLTPLIYPFPVTSGILQKMPNEDVVGISASGRMASVEGRPDLSTDEKIARVKSMISAGSTEAKQNAQGLNCLSSGSPWEQAACLPSTEKLRFLKQMISHPGEQNLNPSSGEPAEENKEPKQVHSQGLLLEPLCPGNDSLGKNALDNQDPFETMSSGRSSYADLEQVHLPTPLKAQNVSLEIETDGPKVGSVPQVHHQIARQTSSSLAARPALQQPQVEKMKIGKTQVATPPVPLPRTLQMMEGAQSGANAVAIEIPDSYHGAAHKEEDVTASGGASCTSASAETGEIAQDSSHHAAAVGREMKTVVDPSAVSAINSDSRIATTKVMSNSKKQSSESKKKSESRKSESLAKKKENSGKELSSKKKSESEKTKKDTGSTIKKEKLIKADVESGEKTVSTVKSEVSTPYKDIVKYMRRMKKELHSNIVKDVAKQTDKLMKKNFERSVSCDPTLLRHALDMQPDVCHEGIVCDCCNNVIYGIRYKCGNCTDFDLCAKCEVLPDVHDQSHVFLKMRRPVRTIADEAPLLRKNIYCSYSRLNSNSGEISEDFIRLSRQSSEDWSATPRGSSGLYWDLYGDELSAGMARLESSLSKLSRSETDRLQEEAEDLTIPKHTDLQLPVQEVPSRMPSAHPSYVPQVSVKEDIIVKEKNGSVQVERIISVDLKTDGCLPESETPYVSEHKEVQNEEVEEKDEEIDVEEFEGSLDENFNVTEEGNASNEDSDSSDDFCVIDPPSREEFEACGMEFSSHSDVLMPLVNPFAAAQNLQCVPDYTTVSDTDLADQEPDSFCALDAQDDALVPSQEENAHVCIECSQPPTVTFQGNTDMDAPEACSSTNGAEGGEATEFDRGDQAVAFAEANEAPLEPHMKAEMTVESGARGEAQIDDEDRKEHSLMLETLKMRLNDLEREMKRRDDEVSSEAIDNSDRERSVHLILQEKGRKAAMENEKLEMMKMTEVAEKLKRWQSVQGESNPREERIRLQQEKEQHFQEFVQKRQEEAPATTKPEAPIPEAPAPSPGDLGNVLYQQSKKDADCQTNPNLEPAAQASQMLQQFTHGVSKAATSAFFTAKDVIYSLQAKQQQEKKMTSASAPQKPVVTSSTDDSWTPPVHVWTPPKNDYMLPKSQWTPPKQDWTPPKLDWTPPRSEWTPPPPPSAPLLPAGDDDESKPTTTTTTTTTAATDAVSHQQAKEDNSSHSSSSSPRQSGGRLQRKDSAGSHGQSDCPPASPPSLTLIPSADSALGQERQAMQRLMEMGFANREQNRKLLQQFNGDLERVVQSLLQEEGGQHWSFHRH